MRLVACPKCRTQFDGSKVVGATFPCPSCGEVVRNVVHEPIDALVHRCSACGASVSAEAVHCEYCQSAIVRDRRQMGLICPECYARTPSRAKYCTNCGVEYRPQDPGSEGETLVCPADNETEMVGRSIGGVLVHECPNCAGLWVPGKEFDRLVQKAIAAQGERASAGLGAAAKPTHRWTGGSGVKYRKCPCCAGVMNRKNFGGRSGIIVDWCGEHGTWLDADELEEIAAYIMEGGLAESAVTPPSERRDAFHPNQVRAMAESERLMAEAKRKQWKRAEGKGVSLGDLLSTLLDW
ncbi:MAG: zf-TFIIB domain-containing protein [Candidatus Eisenbacteria bacterium]|uniref:Zf-TFIIB domain-containing protein n=1 Tax=Eiseniibacteriota bacterium TaxID=2212470 RepID=A0A956N8K1_UNCEI|nr:zf-TFIIB domain-containing protein [Candidatus Eisenbacteria bacterium]MCB9463461.1 zf-TFIIB domain-containing protein [Candidatus Eisenbacteria bacterium]